MLLGARIRVWPRIRATGTVRRLGVSRLPSVANPALLPARTRSVDETRALAGSVAALARPGDLVLVSGELGSGKTAFVQGFGRALGVSGPITSPTFTLAQRYDGEMVVHHLDVYRLDQLSEFHELGVDELLDDDGVVLIEWGEAVHQALPSNYLDVRLTFAEAADERDLVLRPVGSRWSARCEQLAQAISRWADGSLEDGPRAHDGGQPC